VEYTQSENSDYTDAYVSFLHDAMEKTPTQMISKTLTLSNYDQYIENLSDYMTTVDFVCVKNKGTVGSCQFWWGCQFPTVTLGAGTITFANANPDTITDSGTNFQHMQMTAGNIIYFSGTTGGSNDQGFVIQQVGAPQITLATSASVTARAPEALETTAYIVSPNKHLIGPGECLVISGSSIAPSYGLEFDADADSSIIEFWVAGS
jgi:hypothetical protein